MKLFLVCYLKYKKRSPIETRDTCYKCYRPTKSCMCKYTNPIETETIFIILMHIKELKKTKNNTGRFTHLNLKNSEIIVGQDFTHNERINEIIKTRHSYLLYPGEDSFVLNERALPNKKGNAIFILDSTWACSRKVLRLSENIRNLPKVSFTHTKTSNYRIKEQPSEHCLSTIESTLCVLENLNKFGIESINQEDLDKFLDPFNKMVEYQLNILEKL